MKRRGLAHQCADLPKMAKRQFVSAATGQPNLWCRRKPEEHRRLRLSTKAESIQLAAVARRANHSLRARHEWQLLFDERANESAVGSRHSRTRLAKQTQLPQVTTSKLVSLARQLAPGEESSSTACRYVTL